MWGMLAATVKAFYLVHDLQGHVYVDKPSNYGQGSNGILVIGSLHTGGVHPLDVNITLGWSLDF